MVGILHGDLSAFNVLLSRWVWLLTSARGAAQKVAVPMLCTIPCHSHAQHPPDSGRQCNTGCYVAVRASLLWSLNGCLQRLLVPAL